MPTTSRALLTALLSILFYLQAAAQQVIVKGTISSAGTPLKFATIRVKDTRIATYTDKAGSYLLDIDLRDSITLQVSCVGYEAQTKTIGNSSHQTIDWTLNPATHDLAEMVVSASRKPEMLDNIPSSVTVLGKKQLDDNLAVTTDITQVLASEVPGLAPSAQTNSNVGQSLRGRSVLVMIDGIPQSTPLRNGEVDMRSIDPAVLERIDVVKGATAIYGNGAAGGLINYITLSPKDTARLAGQTSFNLTGSLTGLKNSVGGRVAQLLHGKLGKFDYAVSGSYEQTGEWKDAKGKLVGPNYGLGETDSYNAFAKIGFTPNRKSRIQLMYNYYSSLQHSNYILVNGNILTGQPATGILGITPGRPTGSNGNHNLQLSWQADSLIKGTSLHTDAYYESRDDIFYVSFGRFDGSDGQSHTLAKKKGFRFMFNTPLTTYGNLSYGADITNDVTSQPLVDGRVWVPQMKMLNLAPFMETQWTLADDLIAKAGVRVEHVRIGVDDYTTLRITNASGGTVTPSFNVKGGNLTYTATLVNVGLRYNRQPLFSPYVSFSQGFSVSDVGLALRDAKVNDIRKINTSAVLVNNYEAGFVSKMRQFRFEATGFFSTSKLGSDMTYDPATDLFNVTRTPEHIYGFEVVAQYRPISKIDLNGSFSYVEGKGDTARNGHYDSYLNGRRISAPKIAGSLSYRPVNTLELQLHYTGVLKRDRFDKLPSGLYPGNEGTVNAYHLFNFNAAYRVTRSTRLTLGIANLFNADYFPARSQWFVIPGFYSKGTGTSFNIGVSVNY